jgi:diaminopimelate decarboxylase
MRIPVTAEDAELVRRFGTPLYVYQLDDITRALRDLRAALPQHSALHYSLKANPHPDLVAHLGAGGCHAEVSSDGELAVAVAAGVAGERCLYTGPAKTAAEIAAAVGLGVRRFSVESAVDFQRVAWVAAVAGVVAECLVRVATTAGGAGGLRMTGAPTQFAVDPDDLFAHPERFADLPGATLVGAHFFSVSNVAGEDDLIDELVGGIRTAARMRRAGYRMHHVDLGGGFASPYARPGERPRYPRLRERLEVELDGRLPGWRTGRPAVAFESGRYLVGDCGRLLCSVSDVKDRAGRRFVLLDGGINHLGGLSGLGRMLPAATPLAAPHPDAGPATLTGPLCTPADVLSRAAPVGHLVPGQLVVFPHVGAYGLTASLLAFLSRPSPTEVVMRGTQVVSASRLVCERTWSVPADPVEGSAG